MSLCEDPRRLLLKSRFPVLCGLAVSKRHHPFPLLSTMNKDEKCRIIEVCKREDPNLSYYFCLVWIARGLPLSEHYIRRYPIYGRYLEMFPLSGSVPQNPRRGSHDHGLLLFSKLLAQLPRRWRARLGGHSRRQKGILLPITRQPGKTCTATACGWSRLSMFEARCPTRDDLV
jgi:hypothetical protein